MIESKLPDLSLNDWVQSTVEAENLISKLTVENQIVFDSMMGTGTTGIAALKLKRQFLGMEKDVQTFEDAKEILVKKQKQLLLQMTTIMHQKYYNVLYGSNRP